MNQSVDAATDLGRVVVLAGGLSHERDISLRSGRRVADALRAIDVDVEVLDADSALLPSLRRDRPDVVFPTLHGVAGEDGAVREILDLLDIPYVGARPTQCRTAFDKPVAKAVMARQGVATPASVTLSQSTFRDLGAHAVLDAVVGRLGLPLMVKPARGGSALGCGVVHRADDLPAAMVECFSYDDTALIERFITGTEVAVSTIDTGAGAVALPAVEIVVPDGGSYDYAARYTAGGTEFFTPARLSERLTADVADAALTAHRVLDLRHIARTDLIVDAAGVVWFLEVNVAPGLTETSLLPQAAQAASLSLGELSRSLLLAALRD